MRISPLLMAAAFLTFGGCGSMRYQPPDQAVPHAVLALPSQDTQRERGLYFEPVQFNGLAPRGNWLQERFRIPPGEFRLRARVAREARQGTCLLQFTALAGQTYRLDAGLDEAVFTLQALDGNEVVASCESPATVLPTPDRIPGTPSR